MPPRFTAVNFFVKIPGMAMAKHIMIYFSLVESQISRTQCVQDAFFELIDPACFGLKSLITIDYNNETFLIRKFLSHYFI